MAYLSECPLLFYIGGVIIKKSEIVECVITALEKEYTQAVCALTYSKPYELIIAGRLSAQCTDVRVNLVTPVLFSRYDTLKAFADADENDVAEIIKPCGLYITKAKSIVAMAHKLYYEMDGKIPDTVEELVKLPGIGRKTANLIMGDIFHKPAIVTDTHFIRITNRLKLTSAKDPVKVESDLRKLIPPEKSSDFCHRIVLFGRQYCTARGAKCLNCPVIKELNSRYSDFKCKL